ncbi:MAG: DUF234 domain-containing protein [Pseudonocardia sp.]
MLLSKRMVVAERPLSTRPAPKLTRVRIADPYLRFWLRFVEPGLEEIERGRGDPAVHRVEEGWLPYRGVAVEPIVRESVDRLLPDARFGDTRHIGAYWTRANDVGVDLVGASDTGPTGRVSMVGSVKWRGNATFQSADLAGLLRSRYQVPGADAETLLSAVSRAGVEATGADAGLGPADLVNA